jgi:SAM-dependent methyltransferase
VSTNLIKFIPQGTQRILEVGCADGTLGQLILAKGLAKEYVGIEIRPKEADIARQRLTTVHCADAEQLVLPYPDGYFDCLIYGDSVEHLRDPAKLLTYHARLLKPNGFALCSIPNVRNLFVIDHLLQGSWTYTDWGLLDRTHLRFFTLRELRKLFPQVGLEIEQVEYSLRDGTWFTKMYPPESVRAEFLRLYDYLQGKLLKGEDIRDELRNLYLFQSLSREEVPELFTVQFHIKARKPAA